MASPTELRAIREVFSPKQIDAIVHSDAKVNILDGSIRAGKTVASLWRWLIFVANAPPGELVMTAKTVQAAYRNLFSPLMDPDTFGPEIAANVNYTSGAPMANVLGRPVHVIGANDAKAEAKIRGFTAAGAYVDEASLVPKNFFMTLQGRLSVAGSKLFATTNPDSPAHWLRKDVMLSGSADVRRFHFKIADNPFLPPEFVRFLHEQYTGLYFRRFIEGQWVSAEGAVFDMWDESRHLVDVVPAINHWLAVGIDYGTTNPFHAVLLGMDPTGVLYVGSEYRYNGRKALRQLTDAEYSARLRAWLEKPPGLRIENVVPRFMIVDPSATSFRVQLRHDGLTQHAADNTVIDGIRVVSNLLAKDKLRINRRGCPALIEEIPGYSWDDKAALLGEDKPVKVDDHGIDALRYAVYTTRTVWQPHVLGRAA